MYRSHSAHRTRADTHLVVTWRKLIAIVGTIAIAGCGSSEPDAQPTVARGEATVIEVIDGDTLRLAIAQRNEVVRLIGINTPETKHPTKGVQCYGREATAFLASFLPPGTKVRVERDSEARDSYRRLLLYIFVTTEGGERFVNLEIVARGFATPLSIEPNVRYQSHFVEAAFDAERNERGLWRACR